MTSSFAFRTPPLLCTFRWWAAVGVWLNWMITSTVAPSWPPLRASRSLDSLCFLPSANDKPAASKVIRVKSAIRAPHVVVFRSWSFEQCFVSSVLHKSIPDLLSLSAGPRWGTWPDALPASLSRYGNEYYVWLRGGRWYRG